MPGEAATLKTGSMQSQAIVDLFSSESARATGDLGYLGQVHCRSLVVVYA